MKFSLRNEYLNVGIGSKGAGIYQLKYKDKELLHRDGKSFGIGVEDTLGFNDHLSLDEGCRFNISLIGKDGRQEEDYTGDREWVVMDMSNRSMFMDSVSYNSKKKDFYISSRYKIKSNSIELKVYLDNQGQEDLDIKTELIINFRKSINPKATSIEMTSKRLEDKRLCYKLPSIKTDVGTIDIETIYLSKARLEDLGQSARLTLLAGCDEESTCKASDQTIDSKRQEGYICLKAGQKIQAKAIIKFN